MADMNESLQDQILRGQRRKSERVKYEVMERFPGAGSDREAGLLKYVKNAETVLWLQRLTQTVLICFVSSILLLTLCRSIPIMQFLLFGFFKWILIPIKPLLIAQTSGQIFGFVNMLTSFCQVVNVCMIPCAVGLAYQVAKPPHFLYFWYGKLLILRRDSMSSETNSGTYPNGNMGVWISDTHGYRIMQTIQLSTIVDISVSRPKGKKSTKDYVLNFFDERGLVFRFRWGDILAPEDRAVFFEKLEEQLPGRVDLTMLEPFRPQIARQSYTELWLRELSGAPKRDRLTPLSIGSTLENGNYSITKKAGVGGQGIVYFANSKRLAERDVVLKEYVLPIYPDLRVRKKAAERFQAEAAMLGRLDHPQIAKFIELFVEDHRAYVVMDLVEGQTLKELVQTEGRLPEKQVIQIATQVAEILVYIHGQNPPVIHRDLTPDNVMLGEDGLAKLIDFSVAQEASTGVTGSVVGKPNYISPEQFRGKPTTQSDLYSLGATLFYLLTASEPPPISVLHPQSVEAKVSDRLDGIVARCTQLSVSQRISSAEQLLVALRSLESSG